jgi:hypothetical protein
MPAHVPSALAWMHLCWNCAREREKALAAPHEFPANSVWCKTQ